MSELQTPVKPPVDTPVKAPVNTPVKSRRGLFSSRVLMLPSLFALIFLIFALFQGIFALMTIPEQRTLPASAFVNGEYTARLQQEFDSSVPVRDFSIQFWASLRYQLFNEAIPGAFAGNDGWLFTSEEYQASLSEFQPESGALAAICEADAFFRERGISLVILPIPSKTRIYQDQIPGRPLPPKVAARYESVLAALRQQEFLTVDLFSRFYENRESDPLFFKTDTHWTPLGAKLAAIETARSLATRFPSEVPGGRDFVSSRSSSEEITGDLRSFLPKRGGPFRKLPEVESVSLYESIDRNPPVLGLFDDQVIPFILVGTSYSFDPRWHFDGFLKEALKADVLNLAKEGQGPFKPMHDLMSEIAETELHYEIGARIILWEIPERYLAVNEFSGDF